jgi:hypothetical protein
MAKKIDGCYSRSCKHLTVVYRNGGDPDDWAWGCRKYHVYLKQEKKDVVRCGKCKEELKENEKN